MIKPGLIVSCQSEGKDPFNNPRSLALFAKAAEMGGAVAIRSEGIKKTRRIMNSISIPVIGLVKGLFEDGYVRITRSEKEVADLINIGIKIIAIDATTRPACGFNSGPDFIRYIKKKYNILVMADVSCLNDAILSEQVGADFVSTTLSGYTPDTSSKDQNKPDFDLVSRVVEYLNIPVFGEGRINSAMDVKRMKDLGVYGVVIGSAITRPRIITQRFAKAFSKSELK